MPISKDEQKKNYRELEKLKSQMAKEASNINNVALNVSTSTNTTKNDHTLSNTILLFLIFLQLAGLIFFIAIYIMLSVGIKLPLIS
ncbi:MAG: hypothetical protein H6622_16280 [Halobacteriovoraceae bacterium]|nr:hypothetical protein [Halobacteriovoraceae bacterium]